MNIEAVAVVERMGGDHAQRAATCETVYHRSEHQQDLRTMEAWPPGAFAGRRVLGVACGTGWWTAHGVRDAAGWLAIDLNTEGNSDQTRTLDDGSVPEVLKNFPTLEQATAASGPDVRQVQWWQHTRYRELSYDLVWRMELPLRLTPLLLPPLPPLLPLSPPPPPLARLI